MIADLPVELLDIIRGATEELWDGPEDTEFLEEVAKELASQYAKYALAGDDDERLKLSQNIALWKASVMLRAEQKLLKLKPVGLDILESILGVLAQAAKVYLAGKLGK